MAQDTAATLLGKTALITGAARRIGAVVARRLHAEGMNIALHYRGSADAAEALAAELQSQRPDSVMPVAADLLEPDAPRRLVEAVAARWGRLDLLLNNASSFFPTPVGRIDAAAWDNLIGTNLKAPLFLSQACAPLLADHDGVIINMIDIHGLRPLREHSVYGAAKAGLAMVTRVLALDLAPGVRVNGIAPGAILWPEGDAELDGQARQQILQRTPLARVGHPSDIADGVLYLLRGRFLTGEILTIDGGKHLG